MTLHFIGFLTAIYLFARKVVQNEPLKTNIDNVFTKTNTFLSLQKDKTASLVLKQIGDFAKKILLFVIVALLILSFLPDKIYSAIFSYLSHFFLISFLLNFSITWIQNHNKTVKEYLFNFQSVFLIFIPTIVFLLDRYFLTDFMQIFTPLKSLIKYFNIINFQIIWTVVVLLLIYFGAFAIALPIYFILYTIIILTAFSIKIIEKYINSHLLDVIVGIVVIISAYLKMVSKSN